MRVLVRLFSRNGMTKKAEYRFAVKVCDATDDAMEIK